MIRDERDISVLKIMWFGKGLASVSVVIVDIEDGDAKSLRLGRKQALQKSRGDGYVVDEAVSTAERGPRMVAGWTARCQWKASHLGAQKVVVVGGNARRLWLTNHKANIPVWGP